ncbi:MAG TPA: C25 family cysteine peptidase, partial [Candidatus Edwardsbacteria bacterium]|nr:C25 family cysteine peptidase [Candidatus Edwardsbacteria bacterium]
MNRAFTYALAAILLASPLSADVTVSFTIGPRDLSLAAGHGWQQVTLAGGVYRPLTGAPLLPELPRHVLLPPGCEAAGIEITAAAPETVRLGARLQPCPAPQTIGNGPAAAPEIAADEKIYGCGDAYPGALARLTGQGGLGPYRFAAVLIAPVQYLPARNVLLYYRTLSVRVITRAAKSAASPIVNALPALERMAARLAANPQALREYQLATRAKSRPGPKRVMALGDNDPYDYLIITSQRLESAFTPLAQWKTRKGVRAEVRTVEWIAQRFPGADPAEQVRNFIRQEQAQHGVQWVLLAGDVDDVPHRVAAGYPGDLYFSDLSGDWNFNRNATWGEIADSVDLYPDVCVGRLPVSDTVSAANIVAKILGYERDPQADYQTRLLFIGADLDDQTHTGAVKDSIAAQDVAPYAHLRVDRLYPATPTVLNRANVLAALNAGCGLVNFSDHADYYAMGTGSRTGGGQLYLTDAAGLSNAGRPAVIYAIGCYNCAFDKGCIGERFLSAANGAAAVIGCSREAWFITGQPYASTSYLFDRGFFQALLADSCYNLGAALALAKARLVPSSGDGLMRWSQYEINLLGDPELPVWTDSVRSIALQLPDSLVIGTPGFTITATDSVTGLPLAGARVCLWQEADDAYAVDTTNTSGQASFSYDPPDTGTLTVTVTAHDHLPKTGSIPVTAAAQPHLAIAGQAIRDSSGNCDGAANPGEQFALRLLIRNTGAVAADSVRMLVTCDDPMLTPDTAAVVLSAPLAAGDSAWCEAAPRYVVDPACGDQRRIRIAAQPLAPAGAADSVLVTVHADSLALEHFTLAESVGNGNGAADSGETIELRDVRIGNYGSGRADSVVLTLAPAMAGITMLGDTLRIGSIVSNGAVTASGAFSFAATASGPYRFQLTMSDRAGRLWTSVIGVLRRPAAPANITVATDRAGLRVGWDNSAAAAGYSVYRALRDSSDYGEVSGLAIRNCLYYTDQLAAAGRAYSYVVAAIDTSGCLSLPSAAAAGSAAPGTAPGWPQPIAVYSGWNWNGPVAGDLDGDGLREVVMADPSGMVYVWDRDGRPLAGWPRQFGTGISCPVCLADLDKDQRLEMLIAYNDTLAAVKSDGSMLPGWPYVAAGSILGPAVADLDRDGWLEIVVPCSDNTVRALRWNGSVISTAWTWTLPAGNSPKVSVGDVRGTTLPEIVVTASASANSRSYVLDNQGAMLDSLVSSSSGDNYIPAAALLADLDGDGKDEAVVPYLSGNAICAWDSAGQLLWRATPGIVWSTPTAFTAACESLPRVAASDLLGNIVQLDHAGGAIPGWPVYWRAMHAAPLVADLAGDGGEELIVRDDYTQVQALNIGGQTVSGFPITTADGNYASPTITRLAPGAGCDLLADTRGCEVVRWQLNASPAQPPDWATQGHDIFRSSRHGALVDWCGHICRPLTISGDNFFNGDVVVDSGATLTILPGSRLYFSDRRDFENLGADPQRAELIIRGRLAVNGAPDDSVICDTWSDAPCDSSWHGIRIDPGGQAVVNNCAVLHALYGLYYAGVSSAKPTTAGGPFWMGQCRPNPAADRITVDLQLPAAARLAIGVYNVAGQRV